MSGCHNRNNLLVGYMGIRNRQRLTDDRQPFVDLLPGNHSGGAIKT